MNTCSEGSKRTLKAHFADLYNKICIVYNNCDNAAKNDVKKEIILLANRIIFLMEEKNRKMEGAKYET